MLSRSVRDNALGSIIAGIVLAALAAIAGKATGLLPQLWDTGRRAVTWVWRLIVGRFSLTLPGWGWAIVTLILILSIRSLLRHATVITTTESLAVPEWPHLDEIEQSVMRALAQMDGQPIFLTDLASKLQVSQLRVGKALENLETTGFVAPEYNAVYGTKAALTRRGRDYILANEFGR